MPAKKKENPGTPKGQAEHNTSKELIMIVRYNPKPCKDEKLGKHHAEQVTVETLIDFRKAGEIN